jgi:hypothetical protein
LTVFVNFLEQKGKNIHGNTKALEDNDIAPETSERPVAD